MGLLSMIHLFARRRLGYLPARYLHVCLVNDSYHPSVPCVLTHPGLSNFFDYDHRFLEMYLSKPSWWFFLLFHISSYRHPGFLTTVLTCFLLPAFSIYCYITTSVGGETNCCLRIYTLERRLESIFLVRSHLRQGKERLP
jgi:hypothetical protein